MASYVADLNYVNAKCVRRALRSRSNMICTFLYYRIARFCTVATLENSLFFFFFFFFLIGISEVSVFLEWCVQTSKRKNSERCLYIACIMNELT